MNRRRILTRWTRTNRSHNQTDHHSPFLGGLVRKVPVVSAGSTCYASVILASRILSIPLFLVSDTRYRRESSAS